MNTLKNVACLANALGLLCFWPYVAAVLLAVLIGRRPEAFITEFVAHEDQKSAFRGGTRNSFTTMRTLRDDANNDTAFGLIAAAYNWRELCHG